MFSPDSIFPEFDETLCMSCEPFPLPRDAAYYCAVDYGLDMLAALFIAVGSDGRAYVYDEVYESDLIVSAAAGQRSAGSCRRAPSSSRRRIYGAGGVTAAALPRSCSPRTAFGFYKDRTRIRADGPACAEGVACRAERSAASLMISFGDAAI